MKNRVNDLVRLHKAMQKKLKTALYSEQIEIFTLVPEKWCQVYCSEYFNFFEYLVWTSGGILATPSPKEGQAIATDTLHLVTNVYEDGNFRR